VILLGRITVILVTVDSMVDSWLPCMKFYIDLGIKGVMLLLLLLLFVAIFQLHCEWCEKES